MVMVLGLIVGSRVMVLGQGDTLPARKNEFAYYYRVTHHPCTLLSAHHGHKWLNNDPNGTTHNWVVVLVKDILGGGRKVACCTPSSPCPSPARLSRTCTGNLLRRSLCSPPSPPTCNILFCTLCGIWEANHKPWSHVPCSLCRREIVIVEPRCHKSCHSGSTESTGRTHPRLDLGKEVAILLGTWCSCNGPGTRSYVGQNPCRVSSSRSTIAISLDSQRLRDTGTTGTILDNASVMDPCFGRT